MLGTGSDSYFFRRFYFEPFHSGPIASTKKPYITSFDIYEQPLISASLIGPKIPIPSPLASQSQILVTFSAVEINSSMRVNISVRYYVFWRPSVLLRSKVTVDDELEDIIH